MSNYFYLLIGFLLHIRIVSAFYCSLLDKHVFASFPKTRVEKGLKLLHSPEMWSNGACLAFGVPRFAITNVSSTLKLNNDRVIQFHANMIPVTLIARGSNRLQIRVKEDINVNIHVNHNEHVDVGFSVFISISGISNEDCMHDVWRKNNRDWIELVLFSLVDVEYCQKHPLFERWRSMM